eukprot:scaffold1421_cov255-Pinguiococcus_pyrenoidosus.AAC.1
MRCTSTGFWSPRRSVEQDEGAGEAGMAALEMGCWREKNWIRATSLVHSFNTQVGGTACRLLWNVLRSPDLRRPMNGALENPAETLKTNHRLPCRRSPIIVTATLPVLRSLAGFCGTFRQCSRRLGLPYWLLFAQRQRSSPSRARKPKPKRIREPSFGFAVDSTERVCSVLCAGRRPLPSPAV